MKSIAATGQETFMVAESITAIPGDTAGHNCAQKRNIHSSNDSWYQNCACTANPKRCNMAMGGDESVPVGGTYDAVTYDGGIFRLGLSCNCWGMSTGQTAYRPNMKATFSSCCPPKGFNKDQALDPVDASLAQETCLGDNYETSRCSKFRDSGTNTKNDAACFRGFQGLGLSLGRISATRNTHMRDSMTLWCGRPVWRNTGMRHRVQGDIL